jgi:L-threonylcarbamoyladenylate synthase
MHTRIYRPTPYNLKRLAHRLTNGRLVAIPTETVYGLAANALNEDACRAIFEAKGRPPTDPLIVHVRTKAEAQKLTVWNETAEKLAHHFWPGPLTLVLPKTDLIPDLVTSGLSSVAIRIPAQPVFRKLLNLCRLPLAAPSANPFSYISPTTAQHVKDSLDGRIEAILDGGPSRIGLESTILDIRDPRHPRVLRPGGVLIPELARIIGPIDYHPSASAASGNQPLIAPGQSLKHYSPKIRLLLHAKLPSKLPQNCASVSFQKRDSKPTTNQFWLTETGLGSEAANRLFGLLRELDQGRWTAIHLELPPPDNEWYPTLFDRMQRAAAKAD